MTTDRTGSFHACIQVPLPRLAAQTASEWSDELGVHLGCPAVDVRERSEAVMRFPLETVRMELMDGSAVEFKHPGRPGLRAVVRFN